MTTLHWLLLTEEPDTAELEALMVSREARVYRTDATTLAWDPGVYLRGPLTQEETAVLPVAPPEWVGAVLELSTPVERGAAVPPELLFPGGILAAFPTGEPTGVERDSLETLEALAGRLGGAVMADTGEIVVPEVRVDLLLFSDTWVGAADLARALAPVAQMEGQDHPVVPGPAHDDPGHDGYGLVARLDEGGVLSLSASHAEVTPIALAGEGLTDGEVFVYEIRHYPPEAFSFVTSRTVPTTPNEAEDLVDAGVVGIIEDAARVVLAAVGGSEHGRLCDDDGFLVDL